MRKGAGSGMEGDSREAQRARRVTGNMQLLGVEEQRNFWNVPEIKDKREGQDSRRVTLAEMHNGGVI